MVRTCYTLLDPDCEPDEAGLEAVMQEVGRMAAASQGYIGHRLATEPETRAWWHGRTKLIREYAALYETERLYQRWLTLASPSRSAAS